ncbi:site-specific integrase [Pseudomonas sp. BEA3.1]|uniref:site-specific integrase n=1 Tax=Pseudomonas sp. BEA3.1 TaxID=3083251 RepID=UPI002964032C|nr:site-specific integrase [Pseudomonas sp. BEA3.1]MDW2777957.1 site-specific integrase [Pseudomonas sp. BEA3.1]
MAKNRRVQKHASTIKVVRNGKSTFMLLCDDPFLSEFFSHWAYQLALRHHFNSVKAYCSDVRVLIDFVLEVACLLGGLTAEVLSEALDCFEDFLVFGERSKNDIVRAAAKSLGATPVSGACAARYITSANKFIDASERMRLGVSDLKRVGYVSNDHLSVFPQRVSYSSSAPQKISVALKKSTWLAGCLAGGAKQIKFTGLVPKSKKSQIANTDEFGGDEDAFPMDKLVELIESTDCTRDALLWSAGGAFGPRISELLTMLVEDVTPGEGSVEGSVLIIDPDTRRNILSQWLTPIQIDQASHKGRDTTATYLIEPFASHFWFNYARYRLEVTDFERKNPFAMRNKFLFKTLRDYRPLVGSYQTVYERFRAASFKVTGRYYGLHSLRHMYGYYLANFCPDPKRPGRFGLDIRVVQKLMGHKTLQATLRYARKDARMLEATISAINAARMRYGGFGVEKVRLEHLEGLRREIEDAMQEDYA